MYRDDYSRAGYPMLPDFDRDACFTRVEIVSFSVVLMLVTMLPLVDRAGWWYWAGMGVAGAFMLYHVVGWRHQTQRSWPAVCFMHPSFICPWFLGSRLPGRREVSGCLAA